MVMELKKDLGRKWVHGGPGVCLAFRWAGSLERSLMALRCPLTVPHLLLFFLLISAQAGNRLVWPLFVLGRLCRTVTVLWRRGASLVAQLVKNPPAVQETLFWFLGWEDPWRRNRLPTAVFLGFPGGSDGKELACNVGDWSSVPVW